MPSDTAVVSAQSPAARRVLAVIAGAVLVALAAQVAVPLPGTPVPLTLQPLAVLLVGGLLGPELGAASLVTYLAMGAAGLPVFTPNPLLPQGVARLLGPTGGYLLAYPITAYAVGRLVGDGTRGVRIALAAVAGIVLIHIGGLAQLALLTGSVGQAARLGTLPFILGDLLKVALALLILKPTVSPLRARL
jgi:biotin transport system substrate-specific component